MARVELAEQGARSKDGDVEKGRGAFTGDQHFRKDAQTNLGADWMSLIPDSTPMSMLTLPGTHDSAAFTNSWPFVATQTMDIRTQLNAGIRYFDLRCGLRADVVEMVHGPTYLGLTLEAVLNDMYAYLSSHATEALIVQIKRDRTEDRNSTVHFAAAVFSVISQESSRWRTANTTPTLGELRGRIQLFRRYEGPSLSAYGINVFRWQDNPLKPFTIHTKAGLEITIQDHYKFPTPESLPSLIAKKGGDVRELLDLAAADEDANRWYINFTSAFELNFYYQLSPREIAVGGWHLFRWEEGINVRLRSTLDEMSGERRRLGIVAMDFPEVATEDLVERLVLSNFEQGAETMSRRLDTLGRLLFGLLLTVVFLVVSLAFGYAFHNLYPLYGS